MKLKLYVFLSLVLFCGITNAQNNALLEKIDQLVMKYNEYGQFNGAVLVSQEGKVIYKKGIGLANREWNIPNTADTKFRLGSITKQFTAAIILLLAEKGKLKLDQKITDIIKDYPAKTGDRITIHHLLTHTSGIPNYTDFPGFIADGSVRKFYSTQELLNLFKDKDLEFEPGNKFNYSNSGYLLLGAIIEKVTGDSYENVLQNYILNPLDMKDSGFDHFETVISKRASGYDRSPLGFRNSPFMDMSVPFSAGSMYSTVEDLYKWDQALYSDKLLSEESKSKMFTGYIPAFGRGFYAYGWGIGKLPRNNSGDSTNMISHGGGIFGFNTMIIRIPETKSLIVLLNNTPGANLTEMGTSISSIMFDLPYPMPKRNAVDLLSKAILEKDPSNAVAEYKELKKNEADQYVFSENNLNGLGYALLLSGKKTEALAVFKLAVDEYPEAWNVYDSYGEGLLSIGDTAAAIENYKTSINKNPGNKTAIELLKKMNVEVEVKELKISPETLQSYTGEYQLAPNFILTVTTENDRIFTQATGQPKFEIFPSSETNFYLKVVNAQLDFVKNTEGKVTHLILHQNGRDMKADKIK